MVENVAHASELMVSTKDVLELSGLHTGSLGHYLSALGVLRAASVIDGCTNVRGYWRCNFFHLSHYPPTFGTESLCQYLLQHWEPAPFERWWSTVQSASKRDDHAIPKARSFEPDGRVDQLDSVMVQAGRRIFNPLFGTGGNIGKRNLAAVWKRCHQLRKRPEAMSWLKQTLFAENDVSIPELKGAGTWFVFSNKTFNSGQDWYQEGRLSPWSFLLAMEGALLLRGGVHRRLGTQTKGKAVFPFMSRPAEPVTDGQVAHGKAEFWAPLWNKPATMKEVETLFRSGLAEIGGRPASAPHEFAAAALDAAVDAGVSEVIRFSLTQTTSAQTFEALPQERILVFRSTSGQYSRLLLPLITTRWIDRLPYEPQDSKQRGKFVGLRGPLEASIVHLSEDPDDPERWRSLLLLIARIQQRIDKNRKLRELCMPVPFLDEGWFRRAWPDPPIELHVARALASIQGHPTSNGRTAEHPNPFLVNIFGVEVKARSFPSFPKARPNRAVWHEGDTSRALIDVLRRRLLDGGELDLAPIHGTQACSLAGAALFLAGSAFDDQLLTRWLPALTLIGWPRTAQSSINRMLDLDEPLPSLYSLFRPLFDNESVKVDGQPLFSGADSESRKPHNAAVRNILNLLLQGEIDEAVAHARRRYLAAGWRTLDPPANEIVVPDRERLAAALMIPVHPVEIAQRFRSEWLLGSVERTERRTNA